MALALAAIGLSPTTGATDTAAEQTPGVEGWYQPHPTCSTPIGCFTPLAAPPLNPYPAGTLHVGYAAGRETARSYLRFAFHELAGEIESAVLIVPLSTSPADGDANSPTADVQVCLAYGEIVKVEGSFDQPPSVDCAISAPATYVADAEPRLEADLAPFLVDLASAVGVALVPDPLTATPDESWHAAFSAHDRPEPTTPPALLRVTFATPADDPGSGPVTEDLDFSSDVFGAIDPPIGTGFAAIAPPPAAIRNETGETGLGVPAAAAESALPYPYKVAWLLPLVLLVLFPAVLGAMRKDLTPYAGNVASSIR